MNKSDNTQNCKLKTSEVIKKWPCTKNYMCKNFPVRKK